MKHRITQFASLLLIIAISLVLVGCPGKNQGGGQTQGQNLQKVKLLIDWKAEPTYAGFYIAKEKGFYAKRGIDLEIVEGNGATTSAQVIGKGDAYFIGTCSGETTAIARSKGIPVKSVAVFYHEVPTVIYSRADTPIRTPQDLIGKRMGLINGSISLDEYRGLIAANYIDRSKIKEVSTGFEVAPLLKKQVDGLMNYEELTPVELRLQGHDIVTLRLADHGVDAYSLNLIVPDSAVSQEADAIKAITEGSIEGYTFLRDNPTEAAAIFSRLFPEKKKEYVNESTKIVAKLLGKGSVGEQTRAGWEGTIKTMKQLGLLQKDITVDDAVVPQYLKQ